MRQKADKLEKGKWYWDSLYLFNLLRYSHTENNKDFFDKTVNAKGLSFIKDMDGFVRFESKIWKYFLPTPEDIQKYNLNETDNELTT